MNYEENVKEVVEHLQKAVQNAFDNPVSIRSQTIALLRLLLDVIEQAPDDEEFGPLVVDFRTGKIECDRRVTLDAPLKRFVGTYSVEKPFRE